MPHHSPRASLSHLLRATGPSTSASFRVRLLPTGCCLQLPNLQAWPSCTLSSGLPPIRQCLSMSFSSVKTSCTSSGLLLTLFLSPRPSRHAALFARPRLLHVASHNPHAVHPPLANTPPCASPAPPTSHGAVLCVMPYSLTLLSFRLMGPNARSLLPSPFRSIIDVWSNPSCFPFSASPRSFLFSIPSLVGNPCSSLHWFPRCFHCAHVFPCAPALPCLGPHSLRCVFPHRPCRRHCKGPPVLLPSPRASISSFSSASGCLPAVPACWPSIFKFDPRHVGGTGPRGATRVKSRSARTTRRCRVPSQRSSLVPTHRCKPPLLCPLHVVPELRTPNAFTPVFAFAYRTAARSCSPTPLLPSCTPLAPAPETCPSVSSRSPLSRLAVRRQSTLRLSARASIACHNSFQTASFLVVVSLVRAPASAATHFHDHLICPISHSGAQPAVPSVSAGQPSCVALPCTVDVTARNSALVPPCASPPSLLQGPLLTAKRSNHKDVTARVASLAFALGLRAELCFLPSTLSAAEVLGRMLQKHVRTPTLAASAFPAWRHPALPKSLCLRPCTLFNTSRTPAYLARRPARFPLLLPSRSAHVYFVVAPLPVSVLVLTAPRCPACS
ncbi:hypothetical protein TRVL_08392 [Trypanosoma vivax]|nr:hypothetical protein TRVL_08392 [Trypanosoma vivax]